jgi:glucokinase
VNACVGLLATGGSTNHAIHLPAIARAAGIIIDWEDFDRLSTAIPLIARIYPNGSGDVNQFQRAGGMAFTIRTLLDAGMVHGDILTVHGAGLRDQARDPILEDDRLAYAPAPAAPRDDTMLRPVANPFLPDGGMRLLTGNLGRCVIKTSAVDRERWTIEAPAAVFDDQDDVARAFKAGELERDVVVVVRFQGPRANGMPELHKLTPLLGVLQNRGFRVALLTDGRMSGASGKVPAAIHLTPEAHGGGPIARLRDGDMVRICAATGEVAVLIDGRRMGRARCCDRTARGARHRARGVCVHAPWCFARRAGWFDDAGADGCARMNHAVAVDIGGTHARFALAELRPGQRPALGQMRKYRTADHTGLASAWAAFAQDCGGVLPAAACIAIAGPVEGELIRFTNNPWIIRPATIGDELGLDDGPLLLNDFAAMAAGVGVMDESEFDHLGGPENWPDRGVTTVIGPGTGLGVAQSLRSGGRNLVIATEGGHLDFAALDSFEESLLRRLRAQHGRVSTERIGSGPALAAIRETLAAAAGQAIVPMDDAALWQVAIDGVICWRHRRSIGW